MSNLDYFVILKKMSDDVFKKFEERFGKEWGCNCGSSFEPDWVDIISQTKKSLLARYTCQICGREQMFAVSITGERGTVDAPIIEIPRGIITSDDVLDIKVEAGKVSPFQIRHMGKRKTRTRVPTPRITRR